MQAGVDNGTGMAGGWTGGTTTTQADPVGLAAARSYQLGKLAGGIEAVMAIAKHMPNVPGPLKDALGKLETMAKEAVERTPQDEMREAQRLGYVHGRFAGQTQVIFVGMLLGIAAIVVGYFW